MTMLSTPLQRHPLCRSAEVAEFTDRLNGAYYPADVVPVAGQRFAAVSVLNAVQAKEYTIGYIKPGGGVRVTPVQDTTTYHINLALSGSLIARSGAHEVLVRPGTASVHNARQRHVLHQWQPGSEILGLKFSRALVESEMSAMLGHPIDEPVQLAASFDLTTPAGQSWLRLSRFILAELDRPGLLDGGEVRRQYVRLLVAGLLSAQPHNYSAALADAQAPMRPRTLRRALQYIQDNLASALTVNDIAAASGSSVRRLQEAFQDHLDTSPMSYVRAQRLDLARERLASGTRSVTEVAQECGFGHLGRFSASYRERFGELPSRTMTG